MASPRGKGHLNELSNCFLMTSEDVNLEFYFLRGTVGSRENLDIIGWGRCWEKNQGLRTCCPVTSIFKATQTARLGMASHKTPENLCYFSSM